MVAATWFEDSGSVTLGQGTRTGSSYGSLDQVTRVPRFRRFAGDSVASERLL